MLRARNTTRLLSIAPLLALVVALAGQALSPVVAQSPTVSSAVTGAPHGADAAPSDDSETLDFATLRALGASRSRYLAPRFTPEVGAAPATDLARFRADIEPLLAQSCAACHGADKQRGGVRIDTLDPDLVGGADVDTWLDVLSVITNGEMPPEGEAELAPEARGKVIDWLATELQIASFARRGASRSSSLRRMTRYEYEYALQDLLGLPHPFADDLPPDPASEDGFQNSAELLHLSPTQLRGYLESNRKALQAATVRGEQPARLYWDVSMDLAAEKEWARQNQQVAEVRKRHSDTPTKLEEELVKLRERFAKRPGGVHFESLVTGRIGGQSWHYDGAKYAFAPRDVGPAEPGYAPGEVDHIAIVPRGHGFMLELGDRLPEEGDLRVRVVASRASAGEGPTPSLRLAFGWQASNDSRLLVPISARDLSIEAAPDEPETYEFRVPLRDIAPRNWVRGTAKLGGLPSPSEYLKLLNTSLSGGAIRIEHVTVEAPVYDQWPPASHRRVFPERATQGDETAYASDVLAGFLTRAWRRAPTADELGRKLELFAQLRPEARDFEEAMIEVLATALSSPHFLFVGLSGDATERQSSARDTALAARLALFLWCSTPDDELLALAQRGALDEPAILEEQVARMLADPRSERFAQHFVRQWLGLSLLDFLHVDKKTYPAFNDDLKHAMAEEPVAFFRELLRCDSSVLDFLHADFTVADERLAAHYGLTGVVGGDFRRVPIGEQPARGGLLAQAGLLAMNSDGTDSHPLKRGVWLLERLLNDPPPPPPPAVPEIDLADPEIAKLTIKQRIENHRDHPACISCHAKIDPWGIAFENFDAVGNWRTEVQGRPVDATSVLFNGQELAGLEGLKRFLLEHRQDQFVRALVHKLTTFALGRPLSFEDRAAIDGITAEVRRNGDGLATMVRLIAASELVRSE